MQDNQQQPNIEPTPVANLSDGLETLNRTRTLINDDNADPLEIGVSKAPTQVQEVVEPGTTTSQEEQPSTEAPEQVEEQPEVDPEEEARQQRELFTNNLNETLQQSTGLDLNGITEVLAELLQWRNDILSLELEQQQQRQAPQTQQRRSPNIPTAVRPQGRDNIQARNYDFRQSEIDAMSTADYARNRQAITNAYLSGRVLRDN